MWYKYICCSYLWQHSDKDDKVGLGNGHMCGETWYGDSLRQDCGISSALALEILQFYIKLYHMDSFVQNSGISNALA